MSSIRIQNPKDYPYGPLHNDYIHVMNIDKEVWSTVSNYLYSGLLTHANHRRLLRSSPVGTDITKLQYNERKARYEKEVENEDEFRIKIEGLNYQRLDLFQKYNLFFDNEFMWSIINSLRQAYEYLINESTDDSFRKALLSTGNSYLVYNSSNPFFGVGLKDTGRNLVGEVLMEMRQGLLIKLSREKAIQMSLEKDKIIMNYIVAYHLLLKMIDNGEDIKPYFGFRPMEIINKYFEMQKEKIYADLFSIYSTKDNIESALEVKLNDLSFNDKLKILGYDTKILNIYLEDYKDNRYPSLIDIIKSENEPRKRFIANTLFSNYKRKLQENREFARRMIIVAGFLKTLFPDENLTSEELYLKFHSQASSEDEFNELVKNIIDGFTNNTHNNEIMTKIKLDLMQFDSTNDKEEKDSSSSEEEEDEEEKESSSSSSSEENNISEIIPEEEKLINPSKHDKLFDLGIKLSDDRTYFLSPDFTEKERLQLLSSLISNYTFRDPKTVFEIFLNRYQNKTDNLETVSIGIFGNQEIIQDNKYQGKNFGISVKSRELLTELRRFSNDKNYRDMRISDIVINEIHPDTYDTEIKKLVIGDNHILRLSYPIDVIVNSRSYSSPHNYVIHNLYTKFCGVNIGLKALDVNKIMINDLIDSFDFNDRVLEPLSRGSSSDNANIALFEGEFIDENKAIIIFEEDLKKTHILLSTLLLLKAVSFKFKDQALKELLISTGNNSLSYYDEQNLLLGENKNGANIMGFILESCHNRAILDKTIILRKDIYTHLTEEVFRKWVEALLQDMCTLVYRMKYALNTTINSAFVDKVLSNLYTFYPVLAIEKMVIPEFAINLISECYGMEQYPNENAITQIAKLKDEIDVISTEMRGHKKKIEVFKSGVKPKEGEMYKMFMSENEIPVEYKNNIKAIEEIDSVLFTQIGGRRRVILDEKGNERYTRWVFNSKLSEEQINALRAEKNRLIQANRAIMHSLLNREKQKNIADIISNFRENALAEMARKMEELKDDFKRKQILQTKTLQNIRDFSKELYKQEKMKGQIDPETEKKMERIIAEKNDVIKKYKSEMMSAKTLHIGDVKMVSKVYWKYVYSLACHIVSTENNHNVSTHEFQTSISDFEHPSNMLCETIVENDQELNCIIHAMINILIGIQNIKTEAMKAFGLTKEDIILARNILSNLSIKKERQERERARANINVNKQKQKQEEVKSTKPTSELVIDYNPDDLYADLETEIENTNPYLFQLEEIEEEPEPNTEREEILNALLQAGDDDINEGEEKDDDPHMGFVDKKEFVKFGMRGHPQLTNLINKLKGFQGETDEKTKELADLLLREAQTLKSLNFVNKNKRIGMFVSLG